MSKKLYSLKGYRRQWNSATAWNDLVPYLAGTQAGMNTPSAASELYIVSTSAQDASGGTGVDMARVLYLDANGIEKTLTTSINGLTAVSIGSGISFIQFIETYHGVTDERVSVGNIAITSTNGVALPNTTFDLIRAGSNRSQSCRYKVPANSRARIVDYHVSAVKTGGGAAQYDVELRATIFNENGELSNAFHFIRGSYLQDGETFGDDCHFKELTAGAILKISVIPTSISDGNIVKGEVDIEVIENY